MQHLTDQTFALLKRAAALSTELGHNYLGVEHVLLAVLNRDETGNARALKAAGVQFDVFVSRLRDEIVCYPRIPEPPDGADLPVTPRLRAALETGTADRPLDSAALLERLAHDSRSLFARLTVGMGGDPAEIAHRLAGSVGAAASSSGSNLMSTMSIAMYGQHMLDNLVEELRGQGYELRVDSAIVGWLLIHELDGQTLNQIFDEDLRPRLEAAMQAYPPGSVFALSLAGSRVDLLIVKGKPED
ncbi:MAG: hypothetical protein JXB47_13015 [Anaerolineae bacterium]|nr:hypothetical protein [Anaerolineae bacterium]